MIAIEQLQLAVANLPGLSDATLARVAMASFERRYAKDAILYRSGDTADGLYIILSGRVRVSRVTADRIELLHTERAGGVLGEIPVFGGGPIPATAAALEETRCAHVPIAAIRRLLEEDPAFVRVALHRLAERARGLLRRIDELTATTITARVADHVLARSKESLGGSFALGLSQDELAREIGTAREVVVRALRPLISAGAIARAGRSRFVVANLTVLQAMTSRHS